MKREALIKARKDKGMTQAKLASKVGIQRSYYGLIENGCRNPTLKVATNIANALDNNIESLFTDEIFFANKCYITKHKI